LLTALLVAGCAPLGASGTKAPGPVALANRRHEYPSLRAPQRSAARFTAPEQAVGAFATAYVNWTAADVTDRLRTLAALTVGQARAAMTLAAAQTGRDYELRRGGVANSGTVEAIAPLHGHRYEYAVVTRERTTATGTDAYRGLRPAWHVAVATVTQLPDGGWTLSGWQPEN
jgi:hypothetical protein